MFRKKQTLVVAIMLILVLVLSGCGTQSTGSSSSGNQQTSSSGDTIKIGVPLPLTGSEATYGKDMLNAMQLAVDEINAKGGVNGKKLSLFLKTTALTRKWRLPLPINWFLPVSLQ